MKRLFALVLLAAGFTTSAHAALISTTWRDSANLGASGQYIPDQGMYQYVHNIADNGFRPAIDVLDSFSLAINLVDDKHDSFWTGLIEIAAVDLPGRGGDENWIGSFSSWGNEYGGWSMEGLTQLRSDGTLSVTVRSVIGDFYLLSSELTAKGKHNTSANVPEPGALGLLGVGLLGMAIGARRRKQTSR